MWRQIISTLTRVAAVPQIAGSCPTNGQCAKPLNKVNSATSYHYDMYMLYNDLAQCLLIKVIHMCDEGVNKFFYLYCNTVNEC